MPFRNEKSMKIFLDRQLQVYENAKWICLGHEIGHPSIIIISWKKQQWIASLLFDVRFNVSQINHVWLGARLIKSQSFIGKNKSRLTNGCQSFERLKNSEYQCLEIIGNGNGKGKWINTWCN